MPFEDRHIWGITAGIVRILYERLYADEPRGGGGVTALAARLAAAEGRRMRAVFAALDGERRATRIVGGAVRDALLGRAGRPTPTSPPCSGRRTSSRAPRRRA